MLDFLIFFKYILISFLCSIYYTVMMVLLVSAFEFVQSPRYISSLLLVALFRVETIDDYIYCTLNACQLLRNLQFVM